MASDRTGARHIIGIDHVIVGVRDLAAARADFGRLGFNSTPLGRHVGWGTANHCIMFDEGYVELLGILDPGQFTNDLDKVLAEREGLMTVVIGSSAIDATHDAWSAAGLNPAEPKALGRKLETGGGEVDLRFRNIMLDKADSGGLGLFACQHLTPQLLRRPAWLTHPNGAGGLVSVTVVTDDPTVLAAVLGRMFGSSAVTSTDQIWAAHTGAGVILVATPEDALMLHPHLPVMPAEPTPVLVAMTIRVADPDMTGHFLSLQGVPFVRDPSGAITVSADEAHGVLIEFEPARAG